MTNPTCSIDGCVKPARTKSAALCKMHYHREYRNGAAGESAERKRKSRNPECHIDGCSKPDKEAGLCSMHGARLRRHGDSSTVILPNERDMPSGAAHPNWVGSDVCYSAAHDRIKRLHGSASLHKCSDCNRMAQHWSYNHDDPNEQLALGISANPVAYSDSPDYYSPRCVPCHKAFDLGRKESLKV